MLETTNAESAFIAEMADQIHDVIEGNYVNVEDWTVSVDGDRIIVEHDP